MTIKIYKIYNEKFKIEMEDIREELYKLLELQEKDNLIFNIEKRIKEIPEEIKNLKEEIEKTQKEIKNGEENISSMEKRLKDYFYEIEDLEALIIKFEQDKLKVRTNEEYRAVEKEIEETKKKKEKVEDETLNLMEKIEIEKKNFDIFKKESLQKIEDFKKRIKELEEEDKRLKDEIPIRKDERVRISKRIKSEYLENYERIRKIRGTLVVVPVKDGACGGCHASVPTQKIDKLKKTRGIDICEHCGRILYIPEEEL